MSFPTNLLATEDILAELKRRKDAEIQVLRSKIAKHKQAIRELEARIALQPKAKRGRKLKA